MKCFKDSTGREWTIEITIATVKRVESLADVNLVRLIQPRSGATGSLLTELQTDIVLFCDVLYAAMKPQADERGLTDETFAAVLAGQVIADATVAFWDELMLFFRSLPTGQATVAAIMKAKELVKAAVERAVSKIETLTLGDSAGSSPESLESTRVVSPSVN